SNPRRRFATRCRLAHPSAGGDFRGRWLPIRDRAIGPPKEPDWTLFLRNLGDPSGFPRIKFHPKTWPSIGPQLAVTKVEVFREMRLVARTGPRHFHQNRSREGSARVNQRCCRHRTRKMRYQPNVMGLAESRELQKLRNAARVRQSHARIVDQMLLDEFVDVPTVAELLAHRNRKFDLLPQDPIDSWILRPNQVLNKQWT